MVTVRVCCELLVSPSACFGNLTGAASKSSMSLSSQDEALDDVVLSPDLPLEAIAEEMQNTWHLKVSHSHPGNVQSLVVLASSVFCNAAGCEYACC